jgi:hypothetical protein
VGEREGEREREGGREDKFQSAAKEALAKCFLFKPFITKIGFEEDIGNFVSLGNLEITDYLSQI